jgi:hypothetical protein
MYFIMHQFNYRWPYNEMLLWHQCDANSTQNLYSADVVSASSGRKGGFKYQGLQIIF